ncbi:ferrous iron transporter B [Candidatus Oleimmundimicrobium sp.]|uniref:ferrous iron transporter B n=1 Tax=Candidatus Oleimmundimicrobium sp. TaxID=3060597 RepID=UPI002717685F|nr:ferrous iron transporter B [Candidatus Oleimmundimicrobium sp.]MDO8886607.1 ferrous iron transporter B [Candidatus Oleimmundimicrobium sp.]
MKILLMGNPNVGKSVIFSRLTGVYVTASNYPGTTVEFTKGTLKFKGEKAELIDVPGTYTLEPTCEAERVATEMVKEGDLIINVLDATNLERNLYLTFQILALKKPTIVALNIWDDAKHRGINIDLGKLEKLLGVPVVPTVAVSGEGIKELFNRLEEATVPSRPTYTKEERWVQIGRIIDEVQCVTHRHHTLIEKLEDASVQPLFGALLFLAVLTISFLIIRFIGEGLISYIFNPFFEGIYAPLIMKLSSVLGSGGIFHDILIGKLINGSIDFGQSFGLLTTGLYVPFAMVLPYIFSFYLMLGVLEDVGYLPRLAVLADNVMHKLGLHGAAIIPMILGLGCNVPGALSTRILESKRERFIAATIMAIGIPCMAQTAMIIGLVGSYGGRYLAIVFGTLFIVWFSSGLILNMITKGESPEIFLEIPHYRIPNINALAKKLWMRLSGFLLEAIPLVLIGVLFVNILYMIGFIELISNIGAPVVTHLWGLPESAVSALIVGFLRKDVAVGMLGPLGLTAKQAVIGSTVLAVYFPCIATFVVLIKELGIKDTFKSAVMMITVALLIGSILNLIL